ncbi:MAG: DUF1573 domain-containing protein [Pirellulales bacterium]|nr:DUF1573 domain-containing protein [Pirellulales bacterium]
MHRSSKILLVAILLVGGASTIVLLARRHDSSAGPRNVYKPQCSHWSVFRCCQLLGVPVTMNTLAKVLPPNPKGHTLRQLADALQHVGLEAEGHRQTWRQLTNTNMPCVVHLRKPDHYVVVSRVDPDKGHVHVFDGSGRRTRTSRKAFQQRWDGMLLRVKRPRPTAGKAKKNPTIRFDHLLLDAGDVPALGKPVEFAFPFRNEGREPLAVKKVRVRCACLKHEEPAKPVPPGGSGTVKLVYHVEPKKGVFTHTALVETNDPRNPRITLVVTGFSGVEVRVQPDRFFLDRLIAGRDCNAECFVTYSGEWSEFQVDLDDSKLQGATIVSHSCRIIDRALAKQFAVSEARDMQTANQTRLLQLVLRPTGPAGQTVEGNVAIRTNVSGYEQFVLPVAGTVQLPVKAYPSMVVFPQGKPECSVSLVSLTGESFRVVAVDTHSDNLTCRFTKDTVKESTKLQFRMEHPDVSRPASEPIVVRLQPGTTGKLVELPLKLALWPPNKG